MIQFLQYLINFVWARWFAPTRVVERQMDGCQASYMSREDYGIVIGHDKRNLYPYKEHVPYWLIHFDGERKDEWYPKCFFVYQDDDGTWVRSC